MGSVRLYASSICLLIALPSSYPWLVVSQSTVRTLPGFSGPLPFHLETGYVGVGELEENQLFYYFVESEKNPKEDPLLLWLTGGPGCSAWSGFAFQVGPLKYDHLPYHGGIPTLILNPYSWTKVSNIIFLDSPGGTGFSYSNSSKVHMPSDTRWAKEAHEFLRKWLINHPQFHSNPLYIAGDSYAGKIAPIIAQEISNAIETGLEPLFNLKGYLVGNPVTDEKIDGNAVVPYAHGVGLISDELYESAKINCDGDYTDTSRPQCAKDLQAVDECLSGVSKSHILEADCAEVALKPKESVVGHKRSLEESSADLNPSLPSMDLNPSFGCRKYLYVFSYYWANDDSVRKALHIRKGTIGEWKRCHRGMPYITDVPSSVQYHLNVTTRGYRALVYSGDHDLNIPHVGTQTWIRSLNFSIIDDWRSWTVDGQIAGYTRTYSNNLTFATVKGAGHTAPEYNPKECFAMFKRWISLNPLYYLGVPIVKGRINSLPGFPGPLPFYLETGYVGVGKLDEDQLFYYFVESENNPKEDPLMLWLSGGPGCSAWSGFAFEIGPLYFENLDYNGSVPTLGFRQHSWTKVASIIFLDSPVWTGFSYSSGSKDAKNGDIRSSKEVHEFLKKWLIDHPQFLSNPLYIGGDSYSGITIPIIVQEISNGNPHPLLNLQGYLIGNPVTDAKFDGDSVVPHLHGMGIISDELYEDVMKSCKGDYTNPTNRQCSEDLQAVNESYGYLLSYFWANNESVRKAIHIRKASVKQWLRCNRGLSYMSDVQSSLKYHLNLTTKGYRALIYSGDHDLVIPYLGTQAWIRSLNFSIVNDWRSWSVDGQIAGYTRTYSNNLTFATVKGGGHTAAEYMPKECLAMVRRWISYNPL
ncbi:serine carboxypeptidase-like 18 [Magnolia sinica]|uniref:serine carboxypeptidase-like 18 n=1 Tax=Magnolia sinica TaxID=86752 RepID=UPI00265B25C8|nr:serine carboxypeptidase-like 18 [Magnolia sinica]